MKPAPKPPLKPTLIPLGQARFIPAVERAFTSQSNRKSDAKPWRKGR